MLWLPLQGYAATMMPFCQHGKHNHHAAHQMAQAAQIDQDAHTGHHQHTSKASTSCDDCSLCHMCSAIALPLIFAAQANIAPDNLYAIPAQASFSPFFPEQLQRPPLVLPV